MCGPKTGFPKLDEKGVSLIIILGVVAIIVTISLAAISRSVIDVRISKQEEEQARAFSVAELGLERAIVGGNLIGTEDEIEYNVVREPIDTVSNALIYPRSYAQGEFATVWLVGHNSDGSFDTSEEIRFNDSRLDLQWESVNSDADQYTNIEAVLYYQDGTGAFHTRRYPVGPDGHHGEDFDDADTAPGQLLTGFRYRYTLDSLPCASDLCYAVRVRFLNNTQLQPLAVQKRNNPNIHLPPQGYSYTSTATVSDSQVTSVLRRYVLYEDFPTFLDFAIYSHSDLAKP